MYVVGSIPELGSWDTSKAVKLSADTYPVWSVDVVLPAGTAVEYKFIKKNGGTVVWESGSNRVLDAKGTAVSTSWK